MSVLPIIGAATVCAMLCLLLRQYKPEFALPVSVLCALMLLLWSLSAGAQVITQLGEIAADAGVGSTRLRILLKALGICYITQLAKDVCRDSGETAIAERVDFAGRIAIAVLSLPLVVEVVELIVGLVL